MESLRLTTNPLGFPGYEPPVRESASASVRAIAGRDVVVIEFEFAVMGGSMGVATGETVCRAFEFAAAHDLPVLAITESGGARMQEGMLALAQMPATLQSRTAFARATDQPFVAYLRNPTTGGVFASFASTADRILAESGATIGFAGSRVAQAFTGESLPPDSHTAESALAHGLVDAIVPVAELDAALERVWADAPAGTHAPDAPGRVAAPDVPDDGEPTDAWEAVQRARDPQRRERMRALVTPPHGDEILRTGPVEVAGHPCIAIQTSGGSPGPQHFAAARQAATEATRAQIPLLVLVDTPGADPSADSESRGIAREIARTMQTMLHTPAPTIGVVTGEGGSGGALALIAGADVLLMAEGSYFSVIAPEGAAAILKRTDVPQMARDLRCGPGDLIAFGLADEIVPDDWIERRVAELLAKQAGWESPTGGRNRWRTPGRHLTTVT